MFFLWPYCGDFRHGTTFLKYGKYEISSDDERIYITKGVIEETSFFIEKHKVQAVEVEQSLLKRLLGLAEVKLTSAGRLDFEGEKLELNSLYPFLPVKRAYEIINEILPDYEVAQEMRQLPKKSLWVGCLPRAGFGSSPQSCYIFGSQKFSACVFRGGFCPLFCSYRYWSQDGSVIYIRNMY